MITQKSFGRLTDGREVTLFTLTNSHGTTANIINFGAIVTHLFIKDKEGRMEDVVLGYDSIEGYENDSFYLGAIVGRFGNRIARGQFELNGRKYQLTVNDGANHLHGGRNGFHKILWDAEPVETPAGSALALSHTSPDGEEGYPANVEITVTYTLTESDELRIDYIAESDSHTILNPTHHSYFNLSGDFTKPILDHQLTILGERFTPADNTAIPTGELRPVKASPMDFTKPTAIGERIAMDDEQLNFGGGYDHNWVIDQYNQSVRKAASVIEPKSGRVLEVFSDQPGMQFYSGNFLDGETTGKNGLPMRKRTGFCLEMQNFPDAPNKPEFPSAILEPGNPYKQTTIYRFSVQSDG